MLMLRMGNSHCSTSGTRRVIVRRHEHHVYGNRAWHQYAYITTNGINETSTRNKTNQNTEWRIVSDSEYYLYYKCARYLINQLKLWNILQETKYVLKEYRLLYLLITYDLQNIIILKFGLTRIGCYACPDITILFCSVLEKIIVVFNV